MVFSSNYALSGLTALILCVLKTVVCGIDEERFPNYCSKQYPNVQCFNKKKVLVYEKNEAEYMDARDACWLKFTGSPRSDLVAIQNCEELDGIKETIERMTLPNMEDTNFWTSGYSGFQMKNAAFTPVKQWLALGGNSINLGSCNITIIEKVAEEKVGQNEPKVLYLSYSKEKKFSLRYTSLSSPMKARPICQWISQKYAPAEPTTYTATTIITTGTATTCSTVTSEPPYPPSTTNEPVTPTVTNPAPTRPRKSSCTRSCEQVPDPVKCPENKMDFLRCTCLRGCCKKERVCTDKTFDKIRENITMNHPAEDVSKELVQAVKNVTFEKPLELLVPLKLAKSLTNLYVTQKAGTTVPLKDAREFAEKRVQLYDAVMEHEKRLESSSSEVFEALLEDLTGFGQTIGCTTKEWNFTTQLPYIQYESFATGESLEEGFRFPRTSSSNTFITFNSELKLPSHEKACQTPIVSGAVYESTWTSLHTPQTLPYSKIVMLEVSKGESIKLNQTKARIVLSHTNARKREDVAHCMFWNITTQTWSSDGCRMVESLKSRTICECDHLTNFAVLMDVSGREQHDDLKHLLTVVCTSVSMVSLLLTVACLLFVSSLKNRRTAVTTNLCICLFVVNLTASFGLEQTDNTTKCRFFSMMLMYSVSSTFLWMLLEGYLLYQMIILVFSSVGYLRKRWLYALGYGASLLWLVTVTLVLGVEGFYDEERNYFCWIASFTQPASLWLFAGPALLIILLNLVIFGLSLRAAIESNNKKKKFIHTTGADKYTPSENTQRWLKGWTSLLILLGLTWSTGFLYVYEGMSFASYLFIVLNGLQGFFIFVFEILFNKKARGAIFNIVGAKFPLTSASSSNPLTCRTTNTTSLSVRNSSELSMSVKRAGSSELPVRDDKVFFY